MTLSASDIVFYYTGSGSTTATTLSLGGSISLNSIYSGVANNVYDDVTGDESSLGVTHYVGIAIKDTVTGEDYLDINVWISGTVHAAGVADTIYFSIENPSAGGSIQTIAVDTSIPSTASFTVPAGGPYSWATEGAPSATFSYGTLAGGSWFGVWFRRDVPAGADAFANRKVTLTVRGQTTGSPMMVLEKVFTLDFGKDALPVVSQG